MINVKNKDQVLHGVSVRDLNLQSLHEDIINHLIHNLEQDVSRLKKELFRRENNLVDHQTGEDLFDKFGLPMCLIIAVPFDLALNNSVASGERSFTLKEMYDFPLGRLLRSGLGWVGPDDFREGGGEGGRGTSTPKYIVLY